ncbi:UDP-N-acetylmuramoylalanine--D-glutamate ligase [Buchnera aphidicola (Nipponaphis monzeni)]|uniref:UDP-N-acetylmuramoylalanine--D-glutamate ligase n=1 Tax=Buchnera aphidicola (Nipponaphis monzeni) TaxID=2495405 RepID=A0A455TA19_9GAMM|nr:UDP-N-acetylmuramoyl-L-alanine--D-glutamate ligase [Buchnera aphidicola]BBI01186.1 UDP-N-acetylmuramoylalanine--D-glutamate ligase [Buchnera aphidicola (Nipponaphis monzeni)]
MKYNYKHKKILIWGIGITGISCINFFVKKGIYPKVIDTETNLKRLKFINKIPKRIAIKLGNDIKSWIFQSDLIVISPGISLFHPLLQQASTLGIEIIGDIELFCRETNKPIVAITGSNGKTTVTSILQTIAKKSSIRVATGGNIGIPALSILEKPSDIYILELSSFQLETINSLKAYIAVIINITPDHMDRYFSNFNLYKHTKLKIYNNANICILNTKNNFFKKNIHKQQKKITFGINYGDYHLVKRHSTTWVYHKYKKVINLNNILLRGSHNFENVLVTLAISDTIGFSRNITLKTLYKFNGLSHRFQTIYKKNNITCINDSKSTNIGSTIAAIKNVRTKGTLRLLLGGNIKSANFYALKKYLKNKKIKIYCYGVDGKHIFNIFPYISSCTLTLNQAMHLIKSEITSNDVILLSPGCSSTDQFTNFEERGESFKKLSKKILKHI